MNEGEELRWADCGHQSEGGWVVAWAKSIGIHHRRHSEDSVALRVVDLSMSDDRRALCLAVADGVGGGARGDVASEALAIHCTGVPDQLMGDRCGLAAWMRAAEVVVQNKLLAVTSSPGAATLAAAWLGPDGTGHLVRIGDARAYLHRPTLAIPATHKSILKPLTLDQTYAHVGETPPTGANPDDPARMVGAGYMGEPEMQLLYLAPYETLLLCSDGLHRGIDQLQMAAIVDRSQQQLELAARMLVEAAWLAGSEDDISVILARRLVGGESMVKGTEFVTLKNSNLKGNQ